jgi:hypothetical protein
MKQTMQTMTAAAFAAALLASAAPVSAQTTGPVSLSFDLGAQASLTGDVHSGGSGTVLSLPTTVEARSYGDVYGPGFYWAAGLGFKTGESGEFRLSVNYTKNPADNLQVGNVAGLPLFGLFDDYKAFGMDAGYRQYFGTAVARPYVGASVGFVRLDEVKSEFTVPDAGVTLSGVDFLEASTVPSFGFGAGVQVDLNARTAFQAGIELKWHGGATDVDGLAGTGLEPINDDTARWSMPITAGLTVRF